MKYVIMTFFKDFLMTSPMTDPWYINANMTGVYWWDPWHTIYCSTMDPMGVHLFHLLAGESHRPSGCGRQLASLASPLAGRTRRTPTGGSCQGDGNVMDCDWWRVAVDVLIEFNWCVEVFSFFDMNFKILYNDCYIINIYIYMLYLIFLLCNITCTVTFII